MPLEPEEFKVLESLGLFFISPTALSCGDFKITEHPIIQNKCFYPNIPERNSIFKEILGRVLTHSEFYRKESCFLLFFKHNFHWQDQARKSLAGCWPRQCYNHWSVLNSACPSTTPGQEGKHKCTLSIPGTLLTCMLYILCYVVLSTIRKENFKQPRILMYVQ